MSSNILDIFNPPPRRDLTDKETGDCLPCQVMSTVFSLGYGIYLLSGKATEHTDEKKLKGITIEQFEKQNPKWWRASLKTVGIGLIVLGLFRGTDGFLWNTDKTYKPISLKKE